MMMMTMMVMMMMMKMMTSQSSYSKKNLFQLYSFQGFQAGCYTPKLSHIYHQIRCNHLHHHLHYGHLHHPFHHHHHLHDNHIFFFLLILRFLGRLSKRNTNPSTPCTRTISMKSRNFWKAFFGTNRFSRLSDLIRCLIINITNSLPGNSHEIYFLKEPFWHKFFCSLF